MVEKSAMVIEFSYPPPPQTLLSLALTTCLLPLLPILIWKQEAARIAQIVGISFVCPVFFQRWGEWWVGVGSWKYCDGTCQSDVPTWPFWSRHSRATPALIWKQIDLTCVCLILSLCMHGGGVHRKQKRKVSPSISIQSSLTWFSTPDDKSNHHEYGWRQKARLFSFSLEKKSAFIFYCGHLKMKALQDPQICCFVSLPMRKTLSWRNCFRLLRLPSWIVHIMVLDVTSLVFPIEVLWNLKANRGASNQLSNHISKLQLSLRSKFPKVRHKSYI